VANHVVSLVRALPRDRFAIDVACPPSSSIWSEVEGLAGVALHPIRPHRRPAPADARSWLTLLRLVGRADVIHVHSAKAGFLGRLASAARRAGRACVFTPHGWSFWAAAGAEARLYVALERLAARWCHAIVTLSSAERAAGLDAGIGRPEQYRVIPNGVELERFELPRDPVPGRILMIGRLAAPKRPDLALRALAQVRRKLPRAELHLVGDGPLQPRVERLRTELGLDRAVRFLGHRDDVPELLARAECVLLASDYEGCPLAVVEAMAAGVPVVATDAGGTGELVNSGRTGILTPRGDADALATGLEVLLTDPRRGQRLGTAGRRTAERDLSLSTMVERLVGLYDEAVAAPRM
jgi:glycosyltransferase involved in cell wall biosynthesis